MPFKSEAHVSKDEHKWEMKRRRRAQRALKPSYRISIGQALSRRELTLKGYFPHNGEVSAKGRWK